tara:strand:- start:3502 stop:3981 length:480 start_codon:yes stop_codon:yes gene_type:complete
MNIIKNFIDDEIKFKEMQNLLMSADFPWYYQNTVSSPTDKSGFYFTHNLFIDNKSTTYFNSVASPILGRLKFNHLIRIRANCYTNNGFAQTHGWHVDGHENHKVAILGINDCNGYTEFKNYDKFLSKENEIILFEGCEQHRSCTQTDTNLRININVNYI